MPSPSTVEVIRHACAILKARGWTPHWSHDDESPLNIRSAIARATTELVGAGGGRKWRDNYIKATTEVQRQLKAGIIDWESKKPRVSSEAEALLTEVANRLEQQNA